MRSRLDGSRTRQGSVPFSPSPSSAPQGAKIKELSLEGIVGYGGFLVVFFPDVMRVLWTVLQRDANVASKHLINMVEYGRFCEMWTVVLFRQVSEANASGCRGADLCKEFSSLIVRQVSAPPTDSVLERIWVGSVHQAIVVIVRFDCYMLTTSYMRY